MFNFSPRRSTAVVNVMIAIVITMTVNFSYLISMIVEQRESNEQELREQIERRKPECNGILSISRDGYGYLISHTNFSPEYPDSVSTDSVYVRPQTIRFYNLQQSDTLLCTINPPHRGSNPSVAKVLMQNGAEISAPVIYDRPKRDREMVVQLLFYLALTYLLLTIMTINFDVHNFTYRRYMLRCTAVVAATEQPAGAGVLVQWDPWDPWALMVVPAWAATDNIRHTMVRMAMVQAEQTLVSVETPKEKRDPLSKRLSNGPSFSTTSTAED